MQEPTRPPPLVPKTAPARSKRGAASVLRDGALDALLKPRDNYRMALWGRPRTGRALLAVVGPIVAWSALAVDGPRTDIARGYATSCVPQWKVVKRQQRRALHGVAAVSPTDVWAVGWRGERGEGTTRPLIMHWNGRRWSDARLPAVAGGLLDVDAVSAREVWAVGWFDGLDVGAVREPTLVLRWNGSRWSKVRTPLLRGSGHELVSVSAPASNNVWMIGEAREFRGEAGDVRTMLTQRWNGRRWRVLREDPGLQLELEGVSALASAAWRVGWYEDHKPGRTIERWTGLRWRRERITDLAAHNSHGGVAARTSSDVWAVGNGVIEHWDGRRWRLRRTLWFLQAVTAISAADAWAVGDRTVVHWNGGSWRKVATPGVDVDLLDVDAPSSSSVWAVGTSSRAPTRMLIARYGC